MFVQLNFGCIIVCHVISYPLILVSSLYDILYIYIYIYGFEDQRLAPLYLEAIFWLHANYQMPFPNGTLSINGWFDWLILPCHLQYIISEVIRIHAWEPRILE